ncbi:DUF2635 domain-containing protein [Jiella pelagia]|uniref:DUF2635 domain-containing protein n=1 Tax=Jiella pelagia TaxID=2986949 RepID=A0ABY7BZY3_9HYPH|nr:DUF2635 domain-containing protein [Jiella pelagia]WAP69042.1 DUF2635 domain-containing protein [Jiella pelagia]
MKIIEVVPVDGARVRNPETNELISSEGATVPRNIFWLRRLEDGSVKLAGKKTQSKKGDN